MLIKSEKKGHLIFLYKFNNYNFEYINEISKKSNKII